MNIAVIPARSGSKGIPNKNIIDFMGKPLIYWSILSAKASKCIDRVVVSTDSKEIAIVKLIQGYRSRGHLIANTNPIRKRRTHKSDLELDYFGLSEEDLNEEFESGKEIGIGKASLGKILDHLKADL